MRKILASVLLVMICSAGLEARQGTSIGLIMGIPTGMNFKSWLDESTALNVNFAWNIWNRNYFINFDILKHWEVLYNAPFYLGGGARLEIGSKNTSESDFNLGLRAVMGMEIFFGKSPVSMFIEGGVVEDFIRQSEIDLRRTLILGGNGSIGIRYYLSH
jgi:hypothetical protein